MLRSGEVFQAHRQRSALLRHHLVGGYQSAPQPSRPGRVLRDALEQAGIGRSVGAPGASNGRWRRRPGTFQHRDPLGLRAG
jgi:hypothetical protein